MSKASRMVIMTLIALLLPLASVFARTPPDALASASPFEPACRTRHHAGGPVGLAVVPRDLSRHEPGCPQPGQSVAQVQTEGYRILLTYNGAVFDYRAPVAGGAAFLCSGPEQVPPPPAQPAQLASTPAPAPTTSSPSESSGRVVCSGAMHTRLAIGIEAQVRPDGLPNNVRQSASLSGERIGQLSPGERFAIVGGPGCGDNLVWWQIEAGDLAGWTAEGQNGSTGWAPAGARSHRDTWGRRHPSSTRRAGRQHARAGPDLRPSGRRRGHHSQ